MKTNEVSVWHDLLAENNLFHILYGHGTKQERRRAHRLWHKAIELAHGILLIDRSGYIRHCNSSVKPHAFERKIPAIAYIQWNDDQSENRICFDGRVKHSHAFFSAHDMTLIAQYKEQIVDLLFN